MSSSSQYGSNRQAHSRQYAKPNQSAGRTNSSSSNGTTVWTNASSSEAKHDAIPSIAPEASSARRESSHHSERGEKQIYQTPARRTGDVSPLQARKDAPLSPAQNFDGVSDVDLIGRITSQLRSGGGNSLTSMVNTLVTRNQDANSSALAQQIIENVGWLHFLSRI